MGKNKLPPGFRFHPTDVELVKYYLKRKVLGKKLSFKAIAEVDLYKHAPWDLPNMSCLKTGDLKWFFYCPIEKKYAKGARLNRATVYGYWKTTGKDRPVKYNKEVVGMIKTLVFHRGKAPRGDRTDWVMHEYRLEEKDLADRGVVQDTYVLCVVFSKDGMGPRNGAQYGAPFKEEDWSDDDEEDANFPGTGTLPGMFPAFGGACSSFVPESLYAGPSTESSQLFTLPPVVHSNTTVNVTSNIDSDVYAASTFVELESLCSGPSVESSGLYTLPLVFHTNDIVSVTSDIDYNAYAAPTCGDAPQVPVVTDAKVVHAMLDAPQLAQVPQVEESNDNILSMLDMFTEEDSINICDRGQMTGIAIDSFSEAPQVTGDDDIIFMLASFTEDNYLNNVLYPSE